MKIAIVGSRSVSGIDLENYIRECDEIVSGGAKGVDACAAIDKRREVWSI